MKIDTDHPLRGPRAAGAAAYARQAEARPRRPNAGPGRVTASVLGIPESRIHAAGARRDHDADGRSRQPAPRTAARPRARLEEVEKAADQDQLLPLLNRRAFVRELTRYIAFTDRYDTPASLIYFDLNGFKQINDTHGHAGGDAVLTHFADSACWHNVRDSDCVGRLGGDEFGVLLTHANQDQAQKKADHPGRQTARLADALERPGDSGRASPMAPSS